MALPMQLGDIHAVIRTITWIKENCFSPEFAADTRYRELKEQIELFQGALRRLENALQRVPRVSTNATTLIPISDLHPTLNIGDYQATLNECAVFLQGYAQYGQRATSPIIKPFRSAKWYTDGLERRATDLKEKIFSHQQSVTIVLLEVNLELQLQLAQSLPQYQEQMRRLTSSEPDQTLPPISPNMKERLRTALFQNDVIGLTSLQHIPLRESIDSIQHNFDQCSALPSMNITVQETASRYLSLIKAHYLYEVVKSSEDYQQLSATSQYREFISQLEPLIDQRYQTFPSPPAEDELLEELDLRPSIWVNAAPPLEVQRANSTFTNAFEKLLCQIKLPNLGETSRDEIAVTKVNDNTLRINRTTVLNKVNPETRINESIFLLHEDKLIPWYALGSSDGLEIKCRSAPGTWLQLKDRADQLKLQAAFTGYHVYRPREPYRNVEFTATSSRGLSFRRQEFETGEAQLWNWPIPSSSNPDDPESSAVSHASDSTTALSLATTITRGLNNPVFSYQTLPKDGGATIFARLPPPPLLVVFTRSTDQYRIWRVNLEDVKISEARQGERVTVIRQVDRKNLDMRRLSVSEANLQQFDLCAISLPNHPLYQNENVVEPIKGNYIHFSFASETERNQFNGSLKRLQQLRREQQQAVTRGRSIAQGMDNRIRLSATR